MKRVFLIVVALIIVLTLAACGNAEESGPASKTDNTPTAYEPSEPELEPEAESAPDMEPETEPQPEPKPEPEPEPKPEPESEPESDLEPDLEPPTSASGGITSSASVPAFSGQSYVVLNDNKPYFAAKDFITTPFEIYSELDSLGRCGPAYANICKEIMPTEPRGAIGMVKPSGWHTVRYDGLVEGNYLYNRCHLIAYQLAGENANTKNLITGTSWMNAVGMIQFENQVESYVSRTGNHVLYRSTPVFDGNNLVASGVQIEAMSVEDSGAGICFNVFIYNVQPGIVIDYTTGDSHIDESYLAPNNQQPDENGDRQIPDGVTYVLNLNTKKFHIPTCSSVKDIKEKNREDFYGSRDEAIAKGYSPCGRCHP